jgi:acetamidase/formamidase
MERVDLRLILHKDFPLTFPHTHTPEGWVTFGFAESLDEAVAQGLNAMLDLVQHQHDIDRKEALALLSVCADVRISQVVNGVQGVHVILPHEGWKLRG